MENLLTAILLLVGFINFVPLIGVLGRTRLESLYGVTLSDENLVTLMRHRAVLFGIVGGYIMTAAFRVEMRPAAYAAGFLAMVPYVVLVGLNGQANAAIRRVAAVDVVAIVLLSAALVVEFLQRG